MCVPTRTHIIYIALPYNCVIQPWGAKLLAKKRQASEATFFPEPPSSTTSSPVSQVDRRLLIHIHAYTCFRAPPPIVGEHWPRRERERKKKKKRARNAGVLVCVPLDRQGPLWGALLPPTTVDSQVQSHRFRGREQNTGNGI